MPTMSEAWVRRLADPTRIRVAVGTLVMMTSCRGKAVCAALSDAKRAPRLAALADQIAASRIDRLQKPKQIAGLGEAHGWPQSYELESRVVGHDALQGLGLPGPNYVMSKGQAPREGRLARDAQPAR